MSQDILKLRRKPNPWVIVVAILLFVTTGTACSYSVSFDDCQVTCAGSDTCPTDLACVAGMCRTNGSTGACGSDVTGEVTISQTKDTVIDHSLSFSCANTDSTTSAESWYRVFSLPAAGITGNFHITKVTVGICNAAAGSPTAGSGSGSGSDGNPNVTVNVGTYGGGSADATLDLTKITKVQSTTIEIPATDITELQDALISANVPGNANLIVEVANADFKGTSKQVVLGATDNTETESPYLLAPFCGTNAPTQQTNNAHIVITVTGSQ